MIYAINYDLNKKGQDYSGLYESIKKLGDWWHHLDSLWLVNTTYDAEEIVGAIKEHFDPNDRLLVMKLSKDRQGLLTQQAWDWIEEHD